LTVALIVVALIAMSAFGLLLVLARRLRSVTERVNLFLPMSPGSLPHPGTPVGEFAAMSTDGQQITHQDFLGVDRVFAMLSTGCGDCQKEATAFQELDPAIEPRPIVGVTGPAAERVPLVEALAGHVVVLEESDLGPIAGAFELNEFPSVLLIRNGIIQLAEHRLAPVLDAFTAPAEARR
jgi:hypothetical protein